MAFPSGPSSTNALSTTSTWVRRPLSRICDATCAAKMLSLFWRENSNSHLLGTRST